MRKEEQRGGRSNEEEGATRRRSNEKERATRMREERVGTSDGKERVRRRKDGRGRRNNEEEAKNEKVA